MKVNQTDRALVVNLEHTSCYWNEDASETLKSRFKKIHWGFFVCFTTVGRILADLLNELTSYIIFCEGTVTQTKRVTIQPNNKKRVTKDMNAATTVLSIISHGSHEFCSIVNFILNFLSL